MSEIFCKTVLDEVMPAARAMLAVNLLGKGLNELQVSKKLNVTQPAVSQYKNKVRGNMVIIIGSDSEFRAYINSLSNEIASTDIDINTKTCEVCQKARGLKAEWSDREQFICLSDIKRTK